MELFKIGFLSVRLVDVIDISIVTFLFYKLYEVLRGSLAIRILGAILVVFLIWKIVDLFQLVLLKSILDQFLGVGALALIILFAGEIRRFLSIFGRNTMLVKVFRGEAYNELYRPSMERIERGVEDIQNGKMGALIVITGSDSLERIQETGDRIGAEISGRLLCSIFASGSPMHDGAVIIDNNLIAAARCVLPVSEDPNIPPELGLRHRSAIGLAEVSDAFIIVVSEERGEISVARDGKLHRNLNFKGMEAMLLEHYNLNPNATS
jgi:diadenylate cyclase